MKTIKRLRYYLLKLSVPIQKIMQRLHPPEPQTKMVEVYDALLKLQNGDVLLSAEKWHFTNLFIPGFWSHAAGFYWNEKGEPRVIEAVGAGVLDVHFIDWVKAKHHWCVLRPQMPTPFDPAVYRAIVTFWKDQVGEEYDYDFSTKNEAWYCSEIVYSGWQWGCPYWTENIFVIREKWGERTVVPEDFYQAAIVDKKLSVIHEHRDK